MSSFSARLFSVSCIAVIGLLISIDTGSAAVLCPDNDYDGPRFLITGTVPWSAGSDSASSNAGTGYFDYGDAYLGADKKLHGCFWHGNIGWSIFHAYTGTSTDAARILSGAYPQNASGSAWSQNAGAIVLGDLTVAAGHVSYNQSGIGGNLYGMGWNAGVGWIPFEGVAVTLFTPSLALEPIARAHNYTGGTVTLRGYATPGSVVIGTIYEPVTNNDVNLTCSTVDSDGNFTCTSPALTSFGRYTATIVSQFWALNETAVGHSQTFTRTTSGTDYAGPVLILSSPQSGMYSSSGIVVSGLTSSSTSVQVRLDGGAYVSCSIDPIELTFACPDVILPDSGIHLIDVLATDLSNPSLISFSRRNVQFISDAPGLSVDAGSLNNDYTNSTTSKTPTGTFTGSNTPITIKMHHIRPNGTVNVTNASLVGNTFSLPATGALPEGVNTFLIIATDTLNRTTVEQRVIWVDTVLPDATFIPPSDTEFASNSYTLTMTGIEGNGTPIRSMVLSIESPTLHNTLNTATYSATGNLVNYIGDFSVLEVDPAYSTTAERQYTVTIVSVTDIAGNTRNLGTPQSIVFGPDLSPSGIVAATGNGNIAIDATDLTNLTGGTLFADGSNAPLGIELRDQYGNDVISIAGNPTGLVYRTAGNSTYLNQQTRGSGSAAFIFNNGVESQIGLGIDTTVTVGQSNLNLSLTTPNYTPAFRLYAPTALGYFNSTPALNVPPSDKDAQLVLDGIDVTSRVGLKPIAFTLPMSATNFAFKPAILTVFDQTTRDFGLVEGFQNKGFAYDPALVGSALSNTDPSIGLNVSWIGEAAKDFLFYQTRNWDTERFGATGSITPAPDHHGTNFADPTTLLSTYRIKAMRNDLGTQLPVGLASHITYTINGKTATINGDLIGRANGYWDPNQSAVSSQQGIFINGNRSGDATDKTGGQVGSDITVFGALDSQSDKTSIKRNALLMTRGLKLDGNSTNPVPSNLTTLLNSASPAVNYGRIVTTSGNAAVHAINADGGKLIVVGNTNQYGIVTLNGAANITGKKTLLVIGSDLYINGDMTYTPGDPTASLGIVVLANSLGQGGKLYLDPSVKRLVGTIYAEKAIVSYNGSDELDGASDQWDLYQQLDIWGTLISENTIGGSRDTPLRCPIFIRRQECNQITAIRYDLNYLRSYRLIDSAPFDGIPDSAPSGKNIFDASSPYYKYPVIIRYNPVAQTQVPPLFTTSQ